MLQAEPRPMGHGQPGAASGPDQGPASMAGLQTRNAPRPDVGRRGDSTADRGYRIGAPRGAEALLELPTPSRACRGASAGVGGTPQAGAAGDRLWGRVTAGRLKSANQGRRTSDRKSVV